MPQKRINIQTFPIRRMQNFPLVWLDIHIGESDQTEYSDAIARCRQITSSIKLFNDVDQCIDFISDIIEKKAFVILSGALTEDIISILQDIHQVNSIYLLCEERSEVEQLTSQSPKVKGIFPEISSICQALNYDTRCYNQNAVSLSFIPATSGVSDPNLDQLDQSFMYSQILKEILLTIDFDQNHITDFATYCRKEFGNDSVELQIISKLEKEYHEYMPIWWYTYPCCLYSMLNQALRTMKVDVIIKMGFFLRDLHQNIAEIHAEQYANQTHSPSFTVYRGQGMSHLDFDQLLKTKGGLMSFNNLLSTSYDREVSVAFAESNQADPELIGVLFEISIDPSSSSTPFANIRNISYFHEEEEILFSMHSVFRIGQIKQMDSDNNRLWQVELALTKDNDPQLHVLTEYIRKETFPTKKGWHRLGVLLIQLGKYEKAQEICEVMLNQTLDKYEEAGVYHIIGNICDHQGKYAEAITFYEKSIEIKKTRSSGDLSMVCSYSGIGAIYSKMHEYMKAISFHQKALPILEQLRPASDRKLATCYDNIGTVYREMKEYTKALCCHEKALELYQKTLPSNHSDLAVCYNNIAGVYRGMNNYEKALLFCENAQTILEKILPPDHPVLATVYDNIATSNSIVGNYPRAILYHEKALQIFQQTFPSKHPDLALCYYNIGTTYSNMHDGSKALFCCKIALEMFEKALTSNHPFIIESYNTIAEIYKELGEFSKALPFSQRAVDIGQRLLHPNYPQLEAHMTTLKYIQKRLNHF